MDKSHDISVLNSLIETTLDSVKGFSDAAEDSSGGPHAQFFREMAQERSGVASRLQSLVVGLGGDAEQHSSLTAAAHRGFMNLKDVLMGNDDKAVIQEVERGEDHQKEKWQAALQDSELSPETRQTLQECYASVQKGHDRASALKHSLAQ